MAALTSRHYLTADGGGRVESSTHPDTGERVWACSACPARGDGEDAARTHAAQCRSTTTGGNLPHEHWS
ncbi:hypothetical protein MUK60_10135 [Streptomyces sp. LRE541]|uniref:hypothetical protein n=1 Tax=Streptomyces sp. LRE541 TaxID=2931983 RepID=UPI00200D4C53|nr:hypothetical protein [Streptomyces sp. LRE541]UPZ28143.1 hypothetical protein MUK60_10135 [Streptomyces sp. LRE541]